MYGQRPRPPSNQGAYFSHPLPDMVRWLEDLGDDPNIGVQFEVLHRIIRFL